MVWLFLRFQMGAREVVERHAEPVTAGDVVVAAAEILDEGVTVGEDSCRAEALQSAHLPEPGFKPSVVRFNRVVRVPLGGTQRRGKAGVVISGPGMRESVTVAG